jgi:anaerobic selenocysteine-containing dehydrogenase
MAGHIPSRERLAKHERIRAHVAWQWDVPTDCTDCGVDCGGRCAERPRCAGGCGVVVKREGDVCLSCPIPA